MQSRLTAEDTEESAEVRTRLSSAITSAHSAVQNEEMNSLNFEVNATEGEARSATLTTRRGVIETPVFMPVGTAGTVKGIRFEELESPDLDARIILGNTYHLWLRPGIETIRACGGLHKFIGWDRAMLTDSGGFQVWSLGALRKITEEGTEFRSHIDGSLCFLSPEISMDVQSALGAEIAMAFDECAPGEATHDEARRSMELTLRWAKRSKAAFEVAQVANLRAVESQELGTQINNLRHRQALFGIIQGASHLDLRRESLERTVEISFDGYAIGGLSVGEAKQVMMEVIEEIAPRMPADKPRYLMGVGTPEDLIEAVARGVDMFDCVLPTRVARNGTAFTGRGTVSVKAGFNKADFRPIEEGCDCFACRHFTRAYLRHLLNVNEILGLRMVSVHNSHVYLKLMADIRAHLAAGTFGEFWREFVANYIPSRKVLSARVTER
jgi:queuine tRNA-ribosyltransferase